MEDLTAAQWTSKGREHQRLQQWADAIYCYNKAMETEPDGEAKTALEMAQAILSFGNRQIYNV